MDEKNSYPSTVECGQCGKKIKKEEAFYSQLKNPYCDSDCFRLYTED